MRGLVKFTSLDGLQGYIESDKASIDASSLMEKVSQGFDHLLLPRNVLERDGPATLPGMSPSSPINCFVNKSRTVHFNDVEYYETYYSTGNSSPPQKSHIRKDTADSEDNCLLIQIAEPFTTNPESNSYCVSDQSFLEKLSAYLDVNSQTAFLRDIIACNKEKKYRIKEQAGVEFNCFVITLGANIEIDNTITFPRGFVFSAKNMRADKETIQYKLMECDHNKPVTYSLLIKQWNEDKPCLEIVKSELKSFFSVERREGQDTFAYPSYIFSDIHVTGPSSRDKTRMFRVESLMNKEFFPIYKAIYKKIRGIISGCGCGLNDHKLTMALIQEIFDPYSL